ncbi:class I SAM-dependent methyltransferase [Aquamicrobium sp. LC103]|uniref:class I SAM-dependent methyltransferase n=1 Tax=Aquamicrobium sp. LC103 TaxID=1120658 RepID=UPI0010C9E9C2|nr:class I SAM-dependent methyltransferase [Aquamicrobium sp. LC103]TKT74898.1 class I SAM-dependent methyltransferase [Aquamicrobium sp. LC103]
MLEHVAMRGAQLRSLLRAVADKAARDGVGATLKRSAAIAAARLSGRSPQPRTSGGFDAEFGTDTQEIVPLWRLDIDSPFRAQGVRYEASDPEVVRKTLDSLPIRHEDFTFVDLGSGKGRTLLVASEYPFRRVLGVEFSPELCDIARENFRRYVGPRVRCADVMSVCADAADWPPPRGNLVFFLFNPFGKDVFERVIAGLASSLGEEDRTVYLIYCNAVHAGLLDACGFLERLALPVPAAIYRHVPATL